MKATLALAELIAREAHEGQMQQYRQTPYVEHLAAVVDLVEGDEAKAVAWLHDVLEDTPLTALDLAYRGIPPTLVRSVMRLTRREGVPYATYIAEVLASHDPFAIMVKIADLRDHLHDSCPESLRPRYEAALRVLGAAVTS